MSHTYRRSAIERLGGQKTGMEIPGHRQRWLPFSPYSPIGHQPCHQSVKPGSQAAVQTRPSLPTTKTSSLLVLRDTAVTGAPGAARPPFSSHQPCHQSVKPGSQAAVMMTPLTSVTKISSLSVLRETA